MNFDWTVDVQRFEDIDDVLILLFRNGELDSDIQLPGLVVNDLIEKLGGDSKPYKPKPKTSGYPAF